MIRMMALFLAVSIGVMACRSEPQPDSVPAAFTDGSIQFHNATVRYVVEGAGDDLMVVGSSVYYPKAFSERLREHFRMICPDSRHFVPGYAPTPANLDTLTLDVFVEELEAIRQAVAIERMNLLGHSIHAQIALAYATKYPERVSRLILVCGVPYAFGEFVSLRDAYWERAASPERKSVLDANRAKLDSLLSIAPASRSFAVGYAVDGPLYWYDPDFDATDLLDGLENNASLGRLAGILPGSTEVRRQLASLDRPVLVVVGRHDYAIPYEAWSGLVQGLPNVEYQLMDEGSHNPQTEHPDVFDAILLDWYQRHSEDGAAP